MSATKAHKIVEIIVFWFLVHRIKQENCCSSCPRGVILRTKPNLYQPDGTVHMQHLVS